ncbi:ROK family protein [Roseateles amylovorans]|uniref:ROK family protein n=1 Tax=Roseateles amylovorans TaxID=2978473 RepID=A0ABY6AS90_9BURK|nr:ROK family protein [Roseateles amylovorans]UXH76094.1 ROK family protein [Roseateles amylovorans]
MTHALGLDIGGSKMAWGVLAGGRVVDTDQVPLDAGLPAREAVQPLLDRLSAWVARVGTFSALVIGSAPTLDAGGIIERWPNHPHWVGLPLGPLLADFVRQELAWCDDGSAATVADASRLGVASLIHLSLGTGVGGGVWTEGRLLRDRELGHLIVQPAGERCSCGRQGCLQAYASSRSLARHTADGGTVQDWLDRATRMTAHCLINLHELFRPTVVTLSGGIGEQFPSFPDDVMRQLKTLDRGTPERLPQVIRSPSGANASLQGALALAGMTPDQRASICQVLPARSKQ